MAQYEAPLYVNILIPSEGRKRQLGVHSSNSEGHINVHMRINTMDKALLEDAASILNMPITTFVREVACNVAKQLLKHKEEYDAHLKSDGD